MNVRFTMQRESYYGKYWIHFTVIDQAPTFKFFSFQASNGCWVSSYITPGIEKGEICFRGCDCSDLDGKTYSVQFRTEKERNFEFYRIIEAVRQFSERFGGTMNEYKPYCWEIKDAVL